MQQDTSKDLLSYNDEGKAIMPSGLNVLTILTFIGCSIFGLITLCLPVIYKFVLGFIEKAKSSGQEISAKDLEELAKNKAAIEIGLQNVVPAMVISITGIVLCFLGALWMRKYKKDGYWIYITGELAPIIASAIIMGTTQYSSVWGVLANIGIPVLFVVLYTLQRKYLTQ
jgi:ABC-type spermidine/putrescine transport system permease subunit II